MSSSDYRLPHHLTNVCACHAQADCEHHRATDGAALIDQTIETAVVRALLPNGGTRRRFLRVLGAAGLLAAINEFFPLAAAKALAKEPAPLEKKNLQVGFVPITCATPIIMGGPMRFYEKQGLNVSLVKTAGWALIRDKMINKEYDAAHMLSPMPLAISLGAGAQATPMYVAAIENINGQAITLHADHKDKRDPRQWKGFKFAVPFDYSIHNFLLRYYLAEHGVDPDKDVQIRTLPPPEMVANLRARNVDGFLGPEPFNQRAVYEQVGFIHILSKEIWDGHPCCAFGVSEAFVKQNPNTFAALFRAIALATAYAHKPEHRAEIAWEIAPANYLNQPVPVLEQVLTGSYDDGLGKKTKKIPGRVDFDPFPWHSMAIWILTQMKRWGYLKQSVNYKEIAERVFLATDARNRMAELGLKAPDTNSKKHIIMGKVFDPTQPEAYLGSFKIKKA